MQIQETRTARVIAAERWQDVAHAIAGHMPRALGAAETAGYFLVLSAFWGLILYLALIAVR